MELLANERSIHEQFHDIASFRDALARLMSMRAAARRFGREVRCNRMLVNARPAPGMPMQQAIGRLPDKNESRVAMTWLTRAGPFWDDMRRHGADDWLECRGELVTDSAVGEAAFRTLHSIECGLVSFTPSDDWDFSPVEVVWRRKAEKLEDRCAKVDNWRDAGALEDRLREAAPPPTSWNELRQASANRFENLTFAKDCFEPLDGVPFAESSAVRLFVLLDLLNRLAGAFNAAGGRTADGQRIYQDYFTGDNALFSDSSDSEKHSFREEMTFPHPDSPGKPLFCPWHGKESHKTLRLHFSWPIQAGKPVYVVYAGPKITKR